MAKVKLTKEQLAFLTSWLDEADKNNNGSVLLPVASGSSVVTRFCIVNGIPDLQTIKPIVAGKIFPINLVTMDVQTTDDKVFKSIGCSYNRSMRDVILAPELWDKQFPAEVTNVKSQAGNYYSRVAVGTEPVEE